MEKEMKEKKAKKVINHRILDNRMVLGMILLTILTYFLVSVVLGGGIGAVIGVAAVAAGITVSQTALLAVAVIGAFIMLAIHKRWFYPEFEGNLKPGKDFGKWLLICIPVLAAIIIPDLVVMLATGAHYTVPTLKSVMTALVAGTTEEVIFRAVPGSFSMRIVL